MSRSEAGRIGGEKTNKLFKLRYAQSPKKCEHCGVILPYEKRHNAFCNRSCFGLSSRNKKTVTGRSKKKPCIGCGVETKNPKFCGKECSKNHKWQQIKDQISSSGVLIEQSSGYGYNPIFAKRFLTETRGKKCEICCLEKWLDNPIPLVLDHIDGNPTNNKLLNLRLVCGNCNMLLPTFAGRNRGNGRKWRK